MQEMTAGDFSRETGLSPKALRLYVDSGLLLPRRIDENNGYRERYVSDRDGSPGVEHVADIVQPLSAVDQH